MQTPAGFACGLPAAEARARAKARVAIYHLSVKTISRSAGRSATAAAAYRAGVLIADTRTGEVHDYTRRSGVESADLVLPAGAPEWAADRAQLWNAAEQAEKRKNSTVAREFEIALPAELDDGQRRALALDFARELADRHGVAVDVAIHAPGGEGDSRNHHAHVLTSTRRLAGEGFGEKARELDDLKTGPALVTQWRERWAELANQALEQAGRSERIDHRSLAEQGIERVPTVHLGPTAAGIERRGEPSRRGDENRAAGAVNAELGRLGGSIADLDEYGRQLAGKLVDLAAERERRAEAAKLEALPLAELRQRVAGLKSPGVQALLEAMPEPQALLGRLKAVSTAEAKAKGELAKHEPAYQAWQKAHPVRAWLHRRGLWKHGHAAKVEGWLEQQRQELAKAEKDRAAILAEGKELGARLMPQATAEHERREAAHAAAVPVLERREAQERERQQRALAEHLQAERARRQERGKDRGPSL